MNSTSRFPASVHPLRQQRPPLRQNAGDRLLSFAANLLGRRGEAETFVKWRENLTVNQTTFDLLGIEFERGWKQGIGRAELAMTEGIAREIRG